MSAAEEEVQVKKEEVEEEEAPAPAAEKEEEPKKKKAAPKRKRKAKEEKDESSESASGEEEAEATEESKPKKGRKKAAPKPMSRLQRKRADERYVMNGSGRWVSKKRSENGKRNIQSRAIKIARKLLKLEGRMVLLGRDAEGAALLDLTRLVRTQLKDGKSDDDATVSLASEADGFLAKISKSKED